MRRLIYALLRAFKAFWFALKELNDEPPGLDDEGKPIATAITDEDPDPQAAAYLDETEAYHNRVIDQLMPQPCQQGQACPYVKGSGDWPGFYEGKRYPMPPDSSQL